MRLNHILLAIMVAGLWGANFVVIRIGLNNFPPLLLLSLRFSLAALPMVFFLPRPKISWRLITAFGLVFGVGKFSLLFIGMTKGLSPGIASLVLQSQAFFTLLLLAILFHQKPSGRQMLGIAVAFIGIGLITTTLDVQVTLIGLSFAIAAGFLWGVANLLIKQAGQVDMLAFMVWTSLIPPIPLLALSVTIEGPDAMANAFTALTWQGAGAVLYITFVATILGFTIWGKLIHIYGAGKVAPFSLLVPIFGMSSSAIAFGESFGTMRLIAAGLVILGLILANISTKAPKS